MKKAIVTVVSLAVVLCAVLIYRAETVFQDWQVEPAPGLTEVGFDNEAAVQRFSEALRLPTISYDDRSNFDAVAFLDFHALLQREFPLVHQHAERTVINDYSLVFHLRGSQASLEPVLFMSHMDVVPVDETTLDEWTHPPFDGVVENGTIWGRGALDVKIGVMALMEAMELILQNNFRPQRDVYFAFGHDEEVGGKDGAARVAEYFAERGVRFDFILDEGGAVTEGLNASVDQPVAVIGVSEKGYVNLHLTVNSPGGHSSAPPDQTALGILSRAIVRVEDNPFPANLEGIVQSFESIGDRAGFIPRLFMANQWLFSPLIKKQLLANPGTAASLRTTTAATMSSGSSKANILPTRAEAVINFRILPGDSVDSVKRPVIGLVDDERVEISDAYGNNPSPVSPVDSRGFNIIAATIRGLDDNILVAPYMVQGGTDAKHFYPLSQNVYRFLMFKATPKTLKYVHGIDEQIPVADYLQAIRFYYHLVRQSTAARG